MNKARGFHLLLVCTLLTGATTIAVGGSEPATAATALSNTASDEPTVVTCPGTPAQCFADVPPANPFFETPNTCLMQGGFCGYRCGGPGEPCDADNRPYYRPLNTVNRQQMSKFVDNA